MSEQRFEVCIVLSDGSVFDPEHAPLFADFDAASNEASRMALQLALANEGRCVVEVRSLEGDGQSVTYTTELFVVPDCGSRRGERASRSRRAAA